MSALIDTLARPVVPEPLLAGDTRTEPFPLLDRPSQASRSRIMTEAEIGNVRAGLDDGHYLVFINESYEPEAFPIHQDWIRIGRSLASDIRFEGTGMSRRHALIVSQPDGLRILDDRSLNGVYVNGERVDWSILEDGDELTLGHNVLYYANVGEDLTPSPPLSGQ